MEVGSHDGAPRYRNSNNIFLFRHRLSRSVELGITRQTCLPESELAGENINAAGTRPAAISLDGEVPVDVGMDFSWLVKNSLRTVNLDRQARLTRKSTRAVSRFSLKLLAMKHLIDKRSNLAHPPLRCLDRRSSTRQPCSCPKFRGIPDQHDPRYITLPHVVAWVTSACGFTGNTPARSILHCRDMMPTSTI